MSMARVGQAVIAQGRPIRVVNVVTHLAMGGAQETIVGAAEMIDPSRIRLSVLAGTTPAPDAALVGRLARAGAALEFLPGLGRPVDPGADIKVAAGLTRRWAASPPDIVHTHSTKAGVLGRVAASRARAPFVVHTVHGWEVHPGLPAGVSYPITRLERALARRTNLLVMVSEADRDWALLHGIARPGAFRVIRSGVPLARFTTRPGARQAARSALGLDDGEPVVGSVMRLCPQKDPKGLLAAFAAARRRVPDARLVVVGDGPMAPAVRREIARLGLGEAVRLTGNRSDVADLLPAFDAFALSSAWEGLPRVLVEAMAAGVPVLATRVGGVHELVHDGVTGLLVAPHDPSALSQGMVALLADQVGPRRLARAARDGLAPFGADLMAAQLTDAYEQLVGARTRCASST